MERISRRQLLRLGAGVGTAAALVKGALGLKTILEGAPSTRPEKTQSLERVPEPTRVPPELARGREIPAPLAPQQITPEEFEAQQRAARAADMSRSRNY